MEVRLGRGLERIRLIGVDPVVSDRELEDPWASLEKEVPVRLEFDRERYAPDGTWLAYVYLPNGRMLNAELIRVGLARPRAEAQNIRYLDLFEEIWTRR
jgi:micrococcal nuclease